MCIRDRTWNSNRTRDLVDIAFTIQKLDDDLVNIVVRCSKNDEDNGRARSVIGNVYAENLKDAKAMVHDMVETANKLSDRNSAREWLLNEMLKLSVDSHTMVAVNPYVMINNVRVDKPEPPVAEEEFDVAAHVESLPLEIDLAEPITETPSSGIYKIDDNDLWKSLTKTLTDSFSMDEIATMVKHTEEVSEAVATVIEPEPVAQVEVVEAPKFITINGKQIQIGWPQ